jgi:hypothetical protein
MRESGCGLFRQGLLVVNGRRKQPPCLSRSGLFNSRPRLLPVPSFGIHTYHHQRRNGMSEIRRALVAKIQTNSNPARWRDQRPAGGARVDRRLCSIFASFGPKSCSSGFGQDSMKSNVGNGCNESGLRMTLFVAVVGSCTKILSDVRCPMSDVRCPMSDVQCLSLSLF